MRYTPFLDEMGVVIKDDPDTDHLVNIIDSALSAISGSIDWGSYEGRRRKPCPEQPVLMAGQPIGMYHCPYCGEMQLASRPHLTPDENYETMTGEPWPAGYYEEEP